MTKKKLPSLEKYVYRMRKTAQLFYRHKTPDKNTVKKYVSDLCDIRKNIREDMTVLRNDSQVEVIKMLTDSIKYLKKKYKLGGMVLW